jgi:hypothetical protein
MFKCGNSNINTKGVAFKLPLSFYQKISFTGQQ